MLKVKADEMLASGQQFHAASQAKEILQKLDTLSATLKVRFTYLDCRNSIVILKTNQVFFIRCNLRFT